MGELKPGSVRTREELKALFGGGVQGGICPSATTLNVLIFTDPAVGEKSGYFDGWLAEEDEGGPVFEYTGHGEQDQTFEGRLGIGNKAILHHVDDKRALRIFKAVGKVPGSGTKRHRYLGRFELDAQQPYILREARNREGEMRRVIVFRMRPVAENFEQNADDVIPPAGETDSKLVPADITTSKIVEPETNVNKKSTRSAAPKTVTERREAQLSEDFITFMESHGRSLRRFQIRVKGLTSTLLTDLYDEAGHVLYELKGTSTREAVRMAVGQLYDYSRHVTPENPKLAVLLPDEPHEDLRALLDLHNIAVCYRSGGSFEGVPGLNLS